MENGIEKLTVTVGLKGLEIRQKDGDDVKTMVFKPVEALMLLDILQNEEENLRRLAMDESPLPFRIEIG